MKESGEIVSSAPFTAVPYPPLTRSPFPDGEGKEEAASPHLLEERLKRAIYESTRAPLARSPLPQTITPCGATVNESH